MCKALLHIFSQFICGLESIISILWGKIKFREVKEPTQNHIASNDRSGWHKSLVLRTLQWEVFRCIKWLSPYLSNRKVKECRALGYESIKALFCSRANSETRAGKDELVTWRGGWKQRTAFNCSETPGHDFYLIVGRLRTELKSEQKRQEEQHPTY